MRLPINAILIVITFLLSNCASDKFVTRAKQKKNLEEIIAFKQHLVKINLMHDFKQTGPVSGINDSIAIQFFKKYEIGTVHVDFCNKYNYVAPSSNFKTCGKKIELYFGGIPKISNTHVLVFDYSKKGLELKDDVSDKHKLAEGIFLF